MSRHGSSSISFFFSPFRGTHDGTQVSHVTFSTPPPPFLVCVLTNCDPSIVGTVLCLVSLLNILVSGTRP